MKKTESYHRFLQSESVEVTKIPEFFCKDTEPPISFVTSTTTASKSRPQIFDLNCERLTYACAPNLHIHHIDEIINKTSRQLIWARWSGVCICKYYVLKFCAPLGFKSSHMIPRKPSRHKIKALTWTWTQTLLPLFLLCWASLKHI
jgi:hypothetical protein